MTAAPGRLRRAQIVVGLVAAVLTILVAAPTASAHTEFDSSTPAAGETVAGPLSEVVLSFTAPAQLAGTPFELLDPTGAVHTPTSVDPTDGTSFVLTFDPPLTAGTYGLRWRVQAGDAHPIEGSFRFDVTGTPALSAGDGDDRPPTSVASGGHMEGMDPATHAAMSGESLDDFLASTSATDDAAALGRAGRSVTMFGTVFGVGVLAALVWTVRGRRDELDGQLAWIRLAGLVVLAGGLIELAALLEADPTATVGGVLSTRPGFADALKMTGGLAVVLGFHGRAGRFVAPARSVSAAVAADLVAEAPVGHDARIDGQRWAPSRSAALGLAGYALVLASFAFDGHTVSEGPWVVHAAANLVHLGAAAVWAGGVFAMTTVAWMRRRRSQPTALAAMVVRFSSIATVSLVAVIVAGSVMAWIILASPGDLFATAWGRTLLAKTALVGIAAGLGAYNHFRLRPALEQRPDDPALARDLRISLSVESVVLVVVIVLTAVLVAAAN